QRVSWMRRLAGDSLMLYDVSDRRITVLAPDGRFARSVSLTTSAPTPEQPDAAEGGPRVSGIYHVVAPFADGTMLARANLGGALSIGGPATRDSMVYLRLAPDGTPRDVIGNFVGDERQIQQSGSGGNMIIVV